MQGLGNPVTLKVKFYNWCSKNKTKFMENLKLHKINVNLKRQQKIHGFL